MSRGVLWVLTAAACAAVCAAVISPRVLEARRQREMSRRAARFEQIGRAIAEYYKPSYSEPYFRDADTVPNEAPRTAPPAEPAD